MERVIDLSEHNGQFDLRILKESGITKVILRIGWLGNRNNHTKDKLLEYYISQCNKYNIQFDFYVYTYCETLDALKSGITFIDSILYNLGSPKNTIYLDLEDGQIATLSKYDLTEQATYFCDYFKLKGYTTGIYASKYWFTSKLNITELLQYKIWLAQWNVKQPTVNFRVDLWQYTDCEQIQGKNFDCSYIMNSNSDDNKGSDFEVKDYINGSTTEIVYQDINCTKQIGYLHPREKAGCYGILDGKALIVYNIDGTNNQKSGFVKWLGGVQ